MIKVTLGTLRNERFNSGLSKIYGYDNFPSLESGFKNLSKVKLIRKEIETAKEMFQALIEKHCEKDSDGKPVVKNNQYTFKGDCAQKFNDSVLEFEKTSVELNLEPIPITDINGLKLSLGELESLENILLIKEQ